MKSKWIQWVCITLLLIIVSPLKTQAVYLRLKTYNSDKWVTAKASGKKTFNQDERVEVSKDTLPDSFTPLNPQTHEKAWKWDGSNVSYETTGESIDTVDEVAQEFIDWLDTIHGTKLTESQKERFKKLLMNVLKND